MKQVKHIALVAMLSCLAPTVRGQNTFPSSGFVGINTATPALPLDVNGDVKASRYFFNGVGANSGVAHHDYGIYQEPGSWTFPYPKLVINYHTGVKVVGYYGYGGVKFYTGATPGGAPTGETLTVGDGDQHVRVMNSLLVGDRMVLGSFSLSSEHRLAVEGSIGARKVKVTQAAWPDYVFEPTYELRSIPELERFIAKNGHLPDVPSAVEVEKEGLDLGDMNAVLLRKLEEFSLYIIELEKRISELENVKK